MEDGNGEGGHGLDETIMEAKPLPFLPWRPML